MTTRIDLELQAALLRARLDAVENEDLVLDLLEWLAASPRGYSEVMDAWRTSCPRLTIWEDALDARLVCRQGARVIVTDAGEAFLRSLRGSDLFSSSAESR